MIKLAVMGDPIAHSLSPSIHQKFAEHSGLSIDYQKMQVNVKTLPVALEKFWANGGVGLNLTSPLKEVALQYCDALSDAAKYIGAVNTLHRVNKKTVGHNTDPDGFLAAIKQENIQLKDKSVLILGAGGAAKAVAYVLKQQAAEVSIYSRKMPPKEPQFYDIVVNAFARTAKMPDFQRAPVSACELAFDLNYDEPEKIFEQFAKQLHAKRYVSGEAMLWAQAAKSFGIWTGAVVSYTLINNRQNIG